MPLFGFVEILNENMQSVGRGLSTFGGEIVRLNSVMQKLKSGEYGLCLMDEFAGGTNFEEGSRIFRAAERALNEMNGIFILTTHFDGVSADANALYQVKKDCRERIWQVLTEKIECGADGAELVARYMDYGLVKWRTKPKECLRTQLQFANCCGWIPTCLNIFKEKFFTEGEALSEFLNFSAFSSNNF